MVALDTESDIFFHIRKGDILLHHPYDNFQTVVDFLAQAAEDPHVLAIKQTLYRTSSDSPLVQELIEAARNGKQVTVVIELKARFDEAANIKWARMMREAGVDVVYGVAGLKTHAKAMLVVRNEGDGIRRYAHLGTGNYHPSTAKFYTDLGLLTCRREITEELAETFNCLTGVSKFPDMQELLVAPFHLHDSFIRLIEQEITHAQEGRPSGIYVKVNALVEEDMIEALYRASAAGVPVRLMVRGMCALRAGVPGLSENIEVRSIVGRFLEHSRIYRFENGGDPKIYLGSADWMPRNLFRRVETVFPVVGHGPTAQRGGNPRLVLEGQCEGQDDAARRHVQDAGLRGRGAFRRAGRVHRRCSTAQEEARHPVTQSPALARRGTGGLDKRLRMKILVVGSGGREHALAWKLKQSPRVSRIYCAPGNAGTALLGENVPISAGDIPALVEFAKGTGIDLTVVGPDDSLAAGIADAFQEANLRIFGPTASAARAGILEDLCEGLHAPPRHSHCGSAGVRRQRRGQGVVPDAEISSSA